MVAPHKTRDMGPLSMRAEFSPGSVNTVDRTVDLVWTTGARVMRGFFERYLEELSLDPDHVRMGRLESGAPLLDSHNGGDLGGVIGIVESARLEEGQGTATVRFASAEVDDHADRVFRKIQEGILRHVSVGYRVHRLELIEDGDETTPVYRATDWEPYELSIVPMGADAGAAVRGGDLATNPCQIVDQLRGTTMAKMKPTEKQTPDAPSATATEARAMPTEAELAQIRAEAVSDERVRSAEIRRVSEALELSSEFADSHVGAGTSVEDFRGLAIDERGSKPSIIKPGTVIESVPGGADQEKWLRGVESWLLVRSGADRNVIAAAKLRGETVSVDAGEFGGMSYVDIARSALERSGVRTAGWSKMDIIGKALTARAGYQATGDFPVALENTMHKALQAAYAITADSWTRFCAIGSVSDFRAHNRYRLGSLGNLELVNENGEFVNQQMADATKETITADTRGSIVALSRQAMINDDMGAFSTIIAAMGRGAARTIESSVFALLALNGGLGPAMQDGDTLFHANHNNLGGGAALSVTSLDADRVVMASQLDQAGNDFLDLRPDVLLVGLGLGGAARILNENQYDPDVSNKFQVANKVAGLFSDVVDTPRITGTRRYLFASPTIAPTLEVAFLDGQRAPHLEVKDGFRVDGVEWKIRIDYGVAAVDFRGAVTDAGA